MFTSLRFLPPDRQREALRSRGFTPEQIEVLLAYRAAYQTGQFAYDAPADYHLAFARWLYLHGKISG
jgi:hypothetical protein